MTDDQSELFDSRPYRKPKPTPLPAPRTPHRTRWELRPPKPFPKRNPCAICYELQVQSRGMRPLSRQATTVVIVRGKRLGVCKPHAVEIRAEQRKKLS